MLNPELERLAAERGLLAPQHEAQRLAFGLACVERVGHLLEEPRAVAALAVLRQVVAGQAGAAELAAAREEARAAAEGHRGSGSIDGSAHAAVSATYAVANAVAGRALQAAGYAAYATVYAYGGYAVSDPSSFEAEFAWQLQELRRRLPALP